MIGIITYKIALFLLEKASFEENDLLSDDIAEDAEELLEESLTISEDRNSINGIFRALSGLLNRSLISNELEMVDFIYLKLDEYQNKFHIIEEEIKKSIEDSLSKISDISDIHRERSNALLLSFKKE